MSIVRHINLKISVRIYAGFAMTLTLLLAVGVIGGYGLEREKNNFDTFNQQAHMATLGLEINTHIAEVRRASQGYFMTGEEAQNALARRAMSDLEMKLDSALSSITITEDRQAVTDISTGFKTFQENFGTFVEQQGTLALLLSDTIQPANADMTDKMQALIDRTARTQDTDSALLNLMLAKAAFSQYVASHDSEDFARSKVTLDKASAALALLDTAMPNEHEAIAAIRTAVETSVKAQEDYAGQRHEEDQLFKQTMENLGNQIAEKANDLKENALINMETTQKTTAANIRLTQWWNIILSCSALLLGMLLAWVIARGIIRPLRGITGTMERLAQNDKTVEVPALVNRDEIGQMARAVLVFKENALRMDQMAAAQEEEKRRSTAEKERLMNELAETFENNVHGVVQAVTTASINLQKIAEALHEGAGDVQRNATTVAAAAEQASTNIDTVAGTATELSASITEISRQVVQSTNIAQTAVIQAEKTSNIMEDLAKGTSKIDEVISLISDIATQTDLLALNATIEAARAGDMGKGFTVVASEVKILSSQTARATSEIIQQIAAIQESTGQAVEAIATITNIIGEINNISSAIASAVEEQSAATREIAHNVEQVAMGTRDVSANIVGVMQGAQQSGNGAADVLTAASGLSEQSLLLTQQVNQFIAHIRAH